MAAGIAGTGADVRVPRRATEVSKDGRRDTRPLAEWRDVDAFVLLGDPGAGKSEALRAEAEAVDGVYLSARDFVVLGPHASDAGKTLFIDGLDEMRASAQDTRAPLDTLRARLQQLDCPRFRLSCREHDWRAQTDLSALCKVAPGGEVRELHLEPLSREEQGQILKARQADVPVADAFLQSADKNGLSSLFGNPLLLDLTIRVVAAKGKWPASRREIYDAACRELATEHSDAHREVRRLETGVVDRVLDDAGLLCAVLLLSGKADVRRDPSQGTSSLEWHTLPVDFGLQDPNAALASKIFVAAAGAAAPRHRSIAEYLSGQAIAKRVMGGLPLGRVLALMQGGDGGIVEPLRGLLGWLAVHDASDRQRLIRLDPLGVVLNGDITVFPLEDRLCLLDALGDAARRDPWFRNSNWISHPLAPLASPDMADALIHILENHSTDASHQALVNCVLDALNNAAPVPGLKSALEAWVEDAEAWYGNRSEALRAWKRCTGFDPDKARDWLDRLHQGSLPDRDARLAADLLCDLYPAHVRADEVLRYWPRPGDVGSGTVMPQFWRSNLIDQSSPQHFAELADSWLVLKMEDDSSHYAHEMTRLRSRILAGVLESFGDQIDDERLYKWLGIGLDSSGFSKLDRDMGGNRIAAWLTDRPARMKALLALGWRETPIDPNTGRRYFWETEQRLHGARLPTDWLYWLLRHGADAPNEELARYCFDLVAHAAVNPAPGFDVPTMEQIETWIEAHADRWPQAADWLLGVWSTPIDGHWQSDRHRRQRKHEAEALASREARRHDLAPYLDAILMGTAPPQLMDQLAGAYQGRFYDINGDTPEQRVQDFLGSDESAAHAAVAGLSRVLERDDLPSADEVQTLDAKGKYPYLRPVALLAARLAHERDPDIVNKWSDSLLSTLVACWLTEFVGDTPGWYKYAVESRPEVVAPLLERHAILRLRHKGSHVNGLWALAREPGHERLAGIVLPRLLERFPLRASESARRVLNSTLLAALHVLDDKTAASIVRYKSDQTSIDVTQRICWLVAALPYDGDVAQRLVELVGNNERRAVALGIALHEQGSLTRALKRMPAATLSHLIQILAPLSKPERPLGPHWVGPAEHRGDVVRALINQLAEDPQHAAAVELQRLAEVSRLRPWRDHIRYSLASQRGVAREAHYVHPSPEAAALTIANRAPANQADLMALTLDHLREIEGELRGADTNGLDAYWRGGKGGAARAPQEENYCRDRLLERLRPRLSPLNISVAPERRAADDKRVDLRVEYMASGRHLVVQIEIKKEGHDKVWLAWRDQLQALYVTEPSADGYGIYLVLWFGYKPRSSPEGTRPESAKDIEQQIAQRVPADDRARIAVQVLDLSLLS